MVLHAQKYKACIKTEISKAFLTNNNIYYITKGLNLDINSRGVSTEWMMWNKKNEQMICEKLGQICHFADN